MSQDRNTNRIRRRRPVADRVSRASQTRLVILIGLFLMVLAMMQHARQPSTWRWMWRMINPGIPVNAGDPRLIPNPPPSPTAGSFVSINKEEEEEEEEEDESSKIENGASLRLTIDPQRLTNIRDDTYFRPVEKDTWFYLFSILDTASERALDEQSLGDVSVLQLYRQTDSYRGKLVDIRGTVRRAHRVIAPHNERGIESYWQLWLFEKDGLTAPCVVYALDLPSDFPSGMSVEAPVELTGFAYKRWAYQGAKGELMVAPVVLAKNATWLRTKETPQPSVTSEQLFWSIAMALAVSFVIVRWTMIWSGSSRRRAQPGGEAAEDRPVNFEFIDPRKDDSPL